MPSRILADLSFGSTPASIKGTRNLLYLAAKGVIPAQPQSARVAQELTAANIAKESRREALAFARAGKAAIQTIANDKFLSGQQANVLGKPPRRMTGYENLPGIRAFLKQEALLNINSGRTR